MSFSFSNLSAISTALDLVQKIRGFSDGVFDESDVKEVVELISELGTQLGVSADWLDKSKLVVEDEHVLSIVYAIVSYLMGQEVVSHTDTGDLKLARSANRTAIHITADQITKWIGFAAQIVAILNQLRGA